MTPFDPSLAASLKPVDDVFPDIRRKREGKPLRGVLAHAIVQPLDDRRAEPLLALVVKRHQKRDFWTVRTPRPPGTPDPRLPVVPLTPWWRIALDVGKACL